MSASELNNDIESPTTKPTSNENNSLLSKFLCLPVPLGLHDPIKISAQSFPTCASSHACALSTDPNVHPFVAVGCLLVAAGITWIKTIMLASIVGDSMTPRCTSNGQCNSGSWCTPLALLGMGGQKWPEVGRENSACFDCFYADIFNATDSPGEFFILAGRDFCESRGDDPDSCDFVRSNRARMSVLTAAMLFLCWSLVGKMIHEELKGVHAHLSLFKFRIDLLRKYKNKYYIWVLQATSWFGQTSRAFIYPTWMACATMNLLAR